MSLFQIAAAIVTLTAIGAYVNRRFVGLPSTIGLMAFSLALSAVVLFLGELGVADIHAAAAFVAGIDFSEVLLHGMLSFLLFAGAMQVNLAELRAVRWSVGILATVGVAIATVTTSSIVWAAAQRLHLQVTYTEALLFGALISLRLVRTTSSLPASERNRGRGRRA